MKRLLNLFNPQRIITCYVIFFVVRAEGNVKNSVIQKELERPIQELLGNLRAAGEEEVLLSELPSVEKDHKSVVLHHGNANDFSHQSSQRRVESCLPTVMKGE
jgi:hypothetical protein